MELSRRSLLGMLGLIPLMPRLTKLPEPDRPAIPYQLTHPYGDLRFSRFRNECWEHVTTSGPVLVKEHEDGGYVIVKGHRRAMKMRFKEGKRDIPIMILRDNSFIADFEIKDVEMNPDRMRDPEDWQVNLIAKSMNCRGQMMPVHVALIQGSLMLLDGHARYKAMRRLGHPRINCFVRVAKNVYERPDPVERDELGRYLIALNSYNG